MLSIREFQVLPGAFAARLPGQNAFILKATTGRLSGIDLYLANSCAASSRPPALRVDRQLPSIIEPEDLSVDVFITTHSHACHADPETIRRIRKKGATRFLGPFDSLRVLL